MMFTAVLLWPRFFPRLIHIQVYCKEFKVHRTKYVVFQNMITGVLLCNAFHPRLVPVQKKCTEFVANMLCVKV